MPSSNNVVLTIDFGVEDPSRYRFMAFDNTGQKGFLIVFDVTARNMRASYFADGNWKQGQVLASF